MSEIYDEVVIEINHMDFFRERGEEYSYHAYGE